MRRAANILMLNIMMMIFLGSASLMLRLLIWLRCRLVLSFRCSLFMWFWLFVRRNRNFAFSMVLISPLRSDCLTRWCVCASLKLSKQTLVLLHSSEYRRRFYFAIISTGLLLSQTLFTRGIAGGDCVLRLYILSLRSLRVVTRRDMFLSAGILGHVLCVFGTSMTRNFPSTTYNRCVCRVILLHHDLILFMLWSMHSELVVMHDLWVYRFVNG